VETRLGGVETKLVGVEDRLGKVEHELYGLGKKFRLFNQEILDMQNAHEDLEERVTGLETPRST
jgi:predicted nuclease with TOPRIM domain